MRKYLLACRLIEKPSIILYYKGLENNPKVTKALNVIVELSPEEAVVFNKYAANKLCLELNQDRDILLECGFTEFELIYKY